MKKCQKMEHLDSNWLAKGLIDFEYKKYIFLSYLTYVQKQFSDKKLYPMLPEIRDHHQNLSAYLVGKKQIQLRFPRNVIGVDIKNEILIREDTVSDTELINELDAIVNFSLARLDEQMAIGLELLEYIMHQISIEPIGVTPINNNEGYLIFLFHHPEEVWIYKYIVSPLAGLADEVQIKTFFISKMKKSISNSPEQIKKGLVKENRDLPNPATYSVSSKVDFPYVETLFPVAKRMLINALVA
jgi:hypothetical protein